MTREDDIKHLARNHAEILCGICKHLNSVTDPWDIDTTVLTLIKQTNHFRRDMMELVESWEE